MRNVNHIAVWAYAFESRPLSLGLINGGYAVLGLAVAGGIIGGWRRGRSQGGDGVR